MFHTGDGAPVLGLLWYETKLTKCVEETCIVRREQTDDYYLDYPVGEVAHYGKWRDFTHNGRPRAGLTGAHQCHPEWFATGEPWPTSLPDTEYNPNGIPTCCGLHQVPTTLPINVGFRIGVNYYPPRSTRLPINVGFRIGVRYTALIAVRIPVNVGFSIGVTYTPPTAVRMPINVNFRIGVQYTLGSGTWLRDVHGDYIFPCSYTGLHLIRTVGAGGGGGNASSGGGMNLSGGGGGGGGECNVTAVLTAGIFYTVRVGRGGGPEEDGTATDIRQGVFIYAQADGGLGAVGPSGGAGGSGFSDDPTAQIWHGGLGSDGGPSLAGGGGGSSACYSPSGMPPGDGGDGLGQSGGVPPLPDGGPGGDGGDPPDGGSPGGYSGGGAGGAGCDATDPAGSGWDGRIVIDWPAP